MQVSEIDRAMAIATLMGEERSLVGMGIVAASGINRAQSVADRGGGFRSRSARLGDVFAAPHFSEDMISAVLNGEHLPASGRQYSTSINRNIRGASTAAYQAFEQGLKAELGYSKPTGAFADRHNKAKTALDVALKADDLGIDLGFGATNYGVKGFDQKAGVGSNAGRFGAHRIGPFDRGVKAPREKDFASRFAAAAALTGVAIPEQYKAEIQRHATPGQISATASIMQKQSQEALREKGIEAFPTLSYNDVVRPTGLPAVDVQTPRGTLSPMGPLDVAGAFGITPQSGMPEVTVPDVPSLAGWGFPADLGQVPDVPAPFDEGVPVARGQMAGNALFDAITDARIGSPIEVPDVPPGVGIGFPADMSVPDVPHAGANVAAAVANEIKDQAERERRAEREIDRMVAANMPPDVGAPSLPGVPDTSPFGFANGTTATNPGALPALGVDLPEKQMEAAIRDQRIKDFEEGNYARSWSHAPPDFDRMARDLEKRVEVEAALEHFNKQGLPTFTEAAPAIARPTPSATVGAPTTPQAAPTPRAAAAPAPARPTPAPAPARPTPAPALPAPVEIREAPRVFSGPPPADLPTAGTYPNPAKAPGLGFGNGTFGLPEGMLPGALMGGLFGGPVGALLGGLGGWGLGSLFGNDGPAYGAPGSMSPFGSPFDDLGMAMPHDRHMGSLAEAQAFADSQGGWGGFGGLGDVFGGFGGRNEFGGIVDSGFGLGPESFANPRDPSGSDYRG